MHLETLPQSKAEANAIGGSRFFTGRPCKRGHISARYKHGECIQCTKERDATLIATGAKKEYQRQYIASGAFDQLSYHRMWRAKNPGKSQAACDRYTRRRQSEDPMLYWARSVVWSAKERAHRKGIPFNITPEYVRSICPTHCPAIGCELAYINRGGQTRNTANLDRRIPALGYIIGNVQVISRIANLIKTDASPEEIAKVSAWVNGKSASGNTAAA